MGLNLLLLSLVVGLVLAIFLAGLLWLLFRKIDPEPTVEKRRLEALKGNLEKEAGQIGSSSGKASRHASKKPLVAYWVERLTPLATSFYGTNNRNAKNIGQWLLQAGQSDSPGAIMQVLGLRMTLGLILSVTLSLLLLPLGNTLYLLVGGIGGLVVGGMLPMMSLKSKATARKRRITRSLSDVLDLMVVCVEAGLGLDATLNRLAKEAKAIAPDLMMEFGKVNRDINAGRPRAEVLQQLGQRTGVDELRALCSTLVQADRLGTSVSQSLRLYSEELRTRRKQKAEELAAKASIKMTLPLVFFIFPPLMVIILGPTVIQVIKTFGGSGVSGAGP